jgi:hypothetical protein
MTQARWSGHPVPAELRERYASAVDLARRGSFRTPGGGWTAELVLAHLAATTDTFVEVGAAVKRGERPEYDDPDLVADAVLAERAAESGGLAGVTEWLEASAARLVAHAESLTEAEAATPVRFTVYHAGRRVPDEPRPWGRILASQASFHLPLHLRQLQALGAAR